MSAQEFAPGLVIQHFVPPLRLGDFKAIAFDMDSTLINIECVDEIADAAGRKAEVAEITEAAMRGEITDYKDSLRQRMALPQGVPMAASDRVLVLPQRDGKVLLPSPDRPRALLERPPKRLLIV